MTQHEIETTIQEWVTKYPKKNAYLNDNEQILDFWNTLIPVRMKDADKEEASDILCSLYEYVLDRYLFTRENVIAALEAHDIRGIGYYLRSDTPTYELEGWLNSLAANGDFSSAELIKMIL